MGLAGGDTVLEVQTCAMGCQSSAGRLLSSLKMSSNSLNLFKLVYLSQPLLSLMHLNVIYAAFE